MGLISRGRENLLDFLELRQVLSTHPGTSGTRSGGLRKGQSTCELHGGLSGASLVSSPVDAGAYDLVGVNAGT